MACLLQFLFGEGKLQGHLGAREAAEQTLSRTLSQNSTAGAARQQQEAAGSLHMKLYT